MNPMTRWTLALALPLTAFLLPGAQAGPVDADALPLADCAGDVQVQHQLWNERSCDDCRGTVVVQVGLSNRIECGGDDCSGNVFVQAGLENSVECGGSGADLGGPAGPCPPQLPDGNFWCHLVGRAVPEELCLTFDFCLW